MSDFGWPSKVSKALSSLYLKPSLEGMRQGFSAPTPKIVFLEDRTEENGKIYYRSPGITLILGNLRYRVTYLSETV